MNKKIIKSISFVFLMIFSFIFFVIPSQAANTSLINCAVSQIPEGQTATEVCLSQIKQVAYPLNCGSTSLPYNETCCCAQKTEYTCTWKTRITQTSTMGWVTTSGDCNNSETRGSDCDPNKKPSSRSFSPNTQISVMCCCPDQATITATKKADFIIPQLSIIDTVKLSQEVYCTGDDNSGECHIPWIAEYINGVYKYGFGIGGILAAVVLMAGGLIWLTSAGNASRITQAKDLILGSIIGLMILSTSYMILTMVNPDLVNMKRLKLGGIEKIEVEGDSSNPVNLDQAAIATFLGVKCGGEESVADIVNKSKGKVTYSQAKRGQMSNDKKMYFDCSSYAKFVRECAGLTTVPSYTGDIFKERIEVTGPIIKNLKPGDLIGWPPGEGGGHVFIYLGNDLFGDVNAKQNKSPGVAVSNNLSFKDIQDTVKRHKVPNLYIKK